MQAVEAVTADKSLHTGDLGGTATTAQVTAAVCALIEKAATATTTANAPKEVTLGDAA
jgi:tartrate dehydrogenase/decarboxylase / D-malate dehydrogenase